MRYQRLKPDRRSMGKRASLYNKNRKYAAAKRIAGAYRKYRGKARGVPRALTNGGNYMVKKTRVMKQLTYNQLADMSTGDGKKFNIYFAPWQNVNVVPPTTAGTTGFGYANLFYSDDINKEFTGNRNYNLFRLKGVYMEIRRPKMLLDYRVGGVVQSEFHDALNIPWGTEILHTRDEIQADTITGVLQPTISNVKWGRTIVHPSSWDEAVDDGTRFKICHGGYSKRIWKPSTAAERKWRFTNPSVELEHSTGGMTLMLRDETPIPNVQGPAYQSDQVMFEITATIYMEFKVKI